MKIKLQLPRLLQKKCGGQYEIELSAQNVEEVLQQTKSKYPELYICICNETGRVRQHINLFLNDLLLDKTSLSETGLKSGDKILVFQAVSGG